MNNSITLREAINRFLSANAKTGIRIRTLLTCKGLITGSLTMQGNSGQSILPMNL